MLPRGRGWRISQHRLHCSLSPSGIQQSLYHSLGPIFQRGCGALFRPRRRVLLRTIPVRLDRASLRLVGFLQADVPVVNVVSSHLGRRLRRRPVLLPAAEACINIRFQLGLQFPHPRLRYRDLLQLLVRVAENSSAFTFCLQRRPTLFRIGDKQRRTRGGSRGNLSLLFFFLTIHPRNVLGGWIPYSPTWRYIPGPVYHLLSLLKPIVISNGSNPFIFALLHYYPVVFSCISSMFCYPSSPIMHPFLVIQVYQRFRTHTALLHTGRSPHSFFCPCFLP